MAIPAYCRQREKGRTDRACVKIDGKKITLGIYDSPESRQKYAELIGNLGNSATPDASKELTAPTVNEVLTSYLEYAQKYYRQPDGSMHAHYSSFMSLSRYLRRIAGETLVSDFGPKRLKEVRQAMIDDGLSRKYINAQINRVRRIFKWGTVEEMVPGEVPINLSALEGLREGKTKARETAQVLPVDAELVEATLSHLRTKLGCVNDATLCQV